MSFNGGWLQDHYSRFICIHLGHWEKCVMTKILTQDAKMLHYPLTTDQKENQFFFLREFNDTAKGMNIKLKVFPESYELCGKPERF